MRWTHLSVLASGDSQMGAFEGKPWWQSHLLLPELSDSPRQGTRNRDRPSKIGNDRHTRGTVCVETGGGVGAPGLTTMWGSYL